MKPIIINTKQQLIAEKVRLKSKVNFLRAELESDFQIIKTDLEPILSTVKTVGVAFKGNDQSLFEKSLRFGINILIKGILPGKASWVVKNSVPYLVNNVAANYVKEKKPEILGVIKNILHRMKRKPSIRVD